MSHTYRIKEELWEEVEKKAWEFTIKGKKVIKPTDVVARAIELGLKELDLSKMADKI